jgi:regulator of replication initiation timing
MKKTGSIFCALNTCGKSVTRTRSPGISCSGCNKYFHLKCVNLSNSTAEEIKNNRLSWSCSKCNNSARRSYIIPALDVPATSTATVVKTPTRSPATVQDQISQISDKLTKLKDEFSSYRATTDGTLQQLEQQLAAVFEENNVLKAKINQLEEKLEQQHTENNLEIQGLPACALSQPSETVLRVASAIGCPLTNSEIDCEVIEYTGGDRVVVKFNSTQTKSKFLANGKKFNREKKKFNFNNSNYIIHVNEQLTSSIKKLLYDTKTLGRINNFKFAWINNGRVLLKKTENSTPIHITSHTSLLKLLEQNAIVLPECSRPANEN